MREPPTVDRSNLAPVVALVERVIERDGKRTDLEIQVVVAPPKDERNWLVRTFGPSPQLGGVDGERPHSWLYNSARGTLQIGVTSGGRTDDPDLPAAMVEHHVLTPTDWDVAAVDRTQVSGTCPATASPVTIAEWLVGAATAAGDGLWRHRLIVAPVLPHLGPGAQGGS